MLFNLVIEGNLAAEPELRVTPAGKSVCNLRVAHNTRRFDTAKQEWVNGKTTWVDVTVWETLAERLAKSLKQGDTVIVEGRDLTARAYMGRDEKAAATLQVTAVNVALSMRYKPASSGALVTAGAPTEDPWANGGDEPPF
jgi:single-strand DNA-binding protein